MGSWNDGSRRWVQLLDMQGTTVARNLPPTMPFGLTPQDRMLFMRQLTTYVSTQRQHHQSPAPKGSLGSGAPVSLTPPGAQNTLGALTTVTVPPKLVTTPPITPSPPTHSTHPGELYNQFYPLALQLTGPGGRPGGGGL
jgi:hypothetical protein